MAPSIGVTAKNRQTVTITISIGTVSSCDTNVLELSSMFIQFYFWSCRLRDRLFTLCCRPGFHGLGARSLLSLPVRLGGAKWIQIGCEVFVGPNCWFEIVDANSSRETPVIVIGDETSIAGSCTITATKNVIIEARVLMARNVYISDHTHEYGLRDVAIKDQGVTKVAPVRIREGAWLGQNVVICPGVTIGRNAVVGANSIVREDVPDFSVAAGSPAKIIRHGDHVIVPASQ